MSSDGPLRIGIVGTGFGRNVLLPAFRQSRRATVTAICASTSGRAQTVAHEEAIPGAFGDWGEMVARPDLDVVAIALPPVLQPEVARGALASGKHLFCEKPLAGSLEEAERVAGAAREANLCNVVDFEFGELESWRRARSVVSNGGIGKPLSFAWTWHVESRAQRLQSKSWKLDAELGGGALSNFGSHVLYLLEWMLTRVCRMSAKISSGGGAADTRMGALVELQNGVTGTISIATDAFGGSGHRVEIYGTEGALILENRTEHHLSNFVLTHLGRSTDRRVLVDERTDSQEDGRIRPVSTLVDRFLEGILSGTSVRPSLEDGARVQVLIEAARESDRRGQWSTVPG